jgi:hypothetical protein
MQVPEEDRARYVQDFAASCEQFGMPRLSGEIVGALLVYEPQETSAAGLANILMDDESEVERELEPLIRGGLIQRDDIAPSGAPETSEVSGFRINPDAWSVLLSRQLVSLMTFRRLAERGMSLQESAGAPAQAVLRDMHDLYAYAEVELPAMLERFALKRAEERGQSLTAPPRAAFQGDRSSRRPARIQETA